MDLLSISHQDFTLTIECAQFEDIWAKAKRNIGPSNLHSVYYWSEGVNAVKRNDVELNQGDKADALFFDNTDYTICIEFDTEVRSAVFGSARKKDIKQISFRRQVLTGFINFGNDIGKSELSVSYSIGGDQKSFTFGFEVLSSKLDYHNHWKTIINDIEQEYHLLSLDYLRRTFHSFTPDYNGETPELIWWNIFEQEQLKFIKACKHIVLRPKRQLKDVISYLRADQLRYLPVTLEREYAENKTEPSYKYRIEERVQSNDTPENQFVKFAINQITRKHARLKKHILTDQLPEDKIDAFTQMEESLKHLQRHPFFKSVGPFKGINQENLTLQRATGYNQVYRTWNLLRRAYSLNEGLYRLQTKDIATLYEIWCLIEVSHIVKEQLGISDEDVHNANRTELNGVFTWELKKGESSRILFYKNGIELAELIYNPELNHKNNDRHYIPDFYISTVTQKPDIVLQLTKNDVSDNKKLTYLFDAKYRIDDTRQDGIDAPPEDAINQMHRFRDAIYYKQGLNQSLKKEVIGGYLLFPGTVESSKDPKDAPFYKSIKEVNIGAFPLRPNDNKNRQLLEEFISELLNAGGSELLDKTIPQKGLYYSSKSDGDAVIVACIKNDEQLAWIKTHNEFCLCIDEGTVGAIKPTGPFSHAQYLLLYKQGEKVSDLFFHLTGRSCIKTKQELYDYPDLLGDEFLALGLDSIVAPGLATKEWDLSSEVFLTANGSPVIVKYSYLLPSE